MARKTTPLTDAQVRNAKPKDGKQATYFDGGGMYLLVRPSGDKGWRFKYRLNGKDRLMSFGPYPDISLSQARNLRTEARMLVAKGVDPMQAREEQKQHQQTAKENTFKKVALEWYANQTDLAEKTKNLHMRRLEKDIFPAIGDMPISDIKPKQILDEVLRPMEARGVGELTSRVKSIISQVYRFCVAAGYIERDITTDLAGALKKVIRGHRAAITDPTDLAKLLRSIDEYDGNAIVKHALQLAPLLFVRPGELRAMRWDEVDMDAAEWRFTASKTKTEQIVPLSVQSLAILRSLHVLTGKGELVFPSVRSTSRPISDNTLNAALRRMGYSTDEVTAHGFRATARTILEEVLQERVEYIEHQLGHQVKDALGKAYNRTKHLEQRRRMMQRWSDYLGGIKAGAKVIPTHKVADK